MIIAVTRLTRKTRFDRPADRRSADLPGNRAYLACPFARLPGKSNDHGRAPCAVRRAPCAVRRAPCAV
ncbi:hypothetical protein, partial [Catellatospora coxensis]|uniref:hypothetical protein n=1 Tax=Catellatospora coxensis TaxID=310354 RepID=UPI0031D07FEB